MKVLVTWGSKRGGTAGIGRIIAETFEERGFDVAAASADQVSDVSEFDAVVVGGALYANRWPANVRRFVNRHHLQLRRVPVWFFSSGPLDDSADQTNIQPTREVGALAERVGALEHVTFGGRLSEDASGLLASAMAKENAGDWRNPSRVREWADEIAGKLPMATPGAAADPPGHSTGRWVAYGVGGWLLSTATTGVITTLASTTTAVVVHATAAPLVFAVLAWRYFRLRGARPPLSTAVGWTAMVALVDLVVVAGLVRRSLEMFTSAAETWLPLGLIFAATWLTGTMMVMMPTSDSTKQERLRVTP